VYRGEKGAQSPELAKFGPRGTGRDLELDPCFSVGCERTRKDATQMYGFSVIVALYLLPTASLAKNQLSM